MKTPAGTECEFFYGNYHRGQSSEECRLLGRKQKDQQWSRDLCFTCPIPRIQLANSCKNMIYHAVVRKKMFGFKRQVQISAYCSKNHIDVKTPEIGCGECHPIKDIFIQVDE
jgi:hypothetical protein